jgi:hypothetical protein
MAHDNFDFWLKVNFHKEFGLISRKPIPKKTQDANFVTESTASK